MIDEKNKKTIEDLNLFKSSCSKLCMGRKVDLFVPFMCPISIVDVDVQEYVIDEYDSVELLVLRLYAAGVKTVEGIEALTGIDSALIEKLIFAETYTYGHINPETKELTNAGIETLKDNEDSENLFQHALYNVKRELQVDSLTGSIIRAEAEMRKDRMGYYGDIFRPNLLPKDAVYIDSVLENEIVNRLKLYVSKKILEDGDVIKSISGFRTKEIRYRKAYYVVMHNFDYPMIAISYYEMKSNGRSRVLKPIAISERDARKVEIGESSEYLIRRDSYFEYLNGYKKELEEFSKEFLESYIEEAFKESELNNALDDFDVERNIEELEEQTIYIPESEDIIENKSEVIVYNI